MRYLTRLENAAASVVVSLTELPGGRWVVMTTYRTKAPVSEAAGQRMRREISTSLCLSGYRVTEVERVDHDVT